MSFCLSYAPSLTAPLTLKEFANTDALATFLANQPPVTSKIDSAILVPAVFRNYPVSANERTFANAIETTACILDYDAGDVTAYEIAEKLESLGIDYVIRPSFSNTPEKPRFCAYIPWRTPVPVDKHRAAVEQIVKPLLNGKGVFAHESGTPTQPRFIQPKFGTTPDIFLPDGVEAWQFAPIAIDLADLPAATAEHRAYDPLAFVDARPEARQLFLSALNYIDADTDRETWVSVIGAGLRMFGITPASLRDKKLSTDQWGVIAALEDFSSRGSADKYRNPENGRGIESCTATRLNRDGEWVPSMVMQYGAKCITGNNLMGLTGVIKRTDHLEFEGFLADTFPELVEEARTRFFHDLPMEYVAPTVEQLAAATAQGEHRVAQQVADQAAYRERIKGVLKTMPAGRTKRLATILATMGDEDPENYRFNPAAAIVVSCQLINTITAHRVFTKHGTNPPLSGNLFAMYFDVSGSGKSAAVGYAKRILARAGYEGAIIPRKVFSGSGMFNAIALQGSACLFTADEAKTWLAGSANKKEAGSTNQLTLDGTFMELWGASCQGAFLAPASMADQRLRANQPVPEVLNLRQPNFSLLVTGVPDDINLMTPAMYENGALARTLCFLPIEARDNERPDAWVDDLEKRLSNTDATVHDVEIEAAANMLKALDFELQGQNLGACFASVKAGNGFVEGEVEVSYRTFSVDRAGLPKEVARILLPTPEANAVVFAMLRRMSFRYACNIEKLSSFLKRVHEITYRIALSMTIFDNPTATEIDVAYAAYACELVALIEEPWFERICGLEQEVVHTGPYQMLATACEALLNKNGLLYRSPGGLSVKAVREDRQFSPLNKIIRGLKASSEVVRKESQKTLDLLGIKILPNPNAKGFLVYHPAHAPQPIEGEEHE